MMQRTGWSSDKNTDIMMLQNQAKLNIRTGIPGTAAEPGVNQLVVFLFTDLE